MKRIVVELLWLPFRAMPWVLGAAVLMAWHGTGVTPVSAQTLELGPVETVIGDLHEPASHVFGQIRHLEVDGDGNLYVLDRHANDIRVFNARGEFIDGVGGGGQGPGEFRGLRGVTLSGGGLMHAVDEGNARVSTFELTETGLEFRDSASLGFVPYDVCALGSIRFVLVGGGPATGELIHALDEEGNVIRTFGEREFPEGELREIKGDRSDLLNQGFLHCDEERDLLFFLHLARPLLRAFSPTGEEVWRTTIPDYHEQRYALGRNGLCCRYPLPDPDSGTYHHGYQVTGDGTGRILVSLIETHWERREQAYEIRLFDADTGAQVGHQRTNAFVGAVHEDRAYSFRYWYAGNQDPEFVPQVIVRTLER